MLWLSMILRLLLLLLLLSLLLLGLLLLELLLHVNGGLRSRDHWRGGHALRR